MITSETQQEWKSVTFATPSTPPPSSSAFTYSGGQQEDNKRKSRESEQEQGPPSFQEGPWRVWGPWKIRLIWRSFKEREAVLLRRGASEQVQGERLGLHHCEIGAPTLSLVLFINLPHPLRASSDPHSSQREGGREGGGGLPFFHYWYHCIIQPALTWTKSAEELQRSQNHRQTFSLSFTFTAKGKWTRTPTYTHTHTQHSLDSRFWYSYCLNHAFWKHCLVWFG